MKLNLKHLKERKMSYTTHFVFASSIAVQLLVRSVFLAIHSFLPWLECSKFDIESTISYLKDRHER